MNFARAAFPVLAAFLLAGCALQPQFVPSGSGAGKPFSPVSPASVEIYRTSEPKWEYSEIGIVTLNVTYAGIAIFDIKKIFESFRNQAAQKGADAVVKFDMDAKWTTTTSTTMQPDMNGNMVMVTTTEQQIDYTVSGTMVRKKGE